jgi:hypothetical protein
MSIPARLLLLSGLLPLSALPLSAQLPPLTVPRGHLRIELAGRLDNWDRAWFHGIKQDAAGDVIRSPANGGLFPELGATEARIRAITGVQTPLSLSLGATTGNMLVNVGTEFIGAAYGVTSRITLFGSIPYVRVRVQNRILLDSTTATAGFNPAHPVFGNNDPDAIAQQSGFFGQLEGALATLENQLADPNSFPNDPARRALAQATLTRGRTLQAGLTDYFGAATFVPLAGTAGAAAISGSVDSLRTTLSSDLGIPFTALPFFPAAGLPRDALANFATNPQGTILAQPFEPPILRALGDIEVGAAIALLDRRPAAGSGATLVRSTLQGTVRLRTGELDRPDALFDLGTGDRQPDIQGDLVTDVGVGRIGARLTARYVLQLAARQERRIASPDQLFAPAATLAAVERNPGEIVEGILEPWFRIAPHFSITAGIRHWRKAADRYQYVANQEPVEGLSANLLAQGSKESGTALSAGLSFSHSGVRQNGSMGMPMDAVLRGELVAGSGAGRVPSRQSISAFLRLYTKLW